MEYEYNKNKIRTDLIFGFIMLLFSTFITVMIFRKMFLNLNDFHFGKIIFALTSIILFSILAYLFLGTSIIRNKYFKLNQIEEVKIDKLTKKIIITNKKNNNKTEIDFSEVESVELFYSWNTNSFSKDLGFSKINIKNHKKPLIITQNNINQYHIYKLFKNKVIKNKTKFMNNLKNYNDNFC